MQNSEFEKSVRQKMDDLNIAPSGDLWEKIEAKLPAEKKPLRWLLFFLLFVVLTGASLWVWDYLTPVKDRFNKTKDSIKEPIARNKFTPQPPGAATAISPADESTKKDTTFKEWHPIPGVKAGLPLNPDKNGKRNDTPASISTADATIKKQTDIQINEKAKTMIQTIAPSAEQDEDATVDTTNPTASLDTRVSNDPLPATPSINLIPPLKNVTDSLPEISKDTLTAFAKSEPIREKNSQNRKYGIHAGAGFSSVKTGLFSSEPLFADAMVYNSPGSPGSPAIVVEPNNPKAAFSFSAGVYLQQKLNDRWSVYTGLNYSYQSNELNVGNKVDSAFSQYFAARNIQADNFYRTGNSIAYKNKFHLAEIPLLLQYNVIKKWPLHLEMGAGIGYLLASNALVYNSSSRSYVTDKAVFNKFLLSVSGGAGFDIAKKSNLPFSIGYRFNYSLSSATKKEYGKQHLLNSIFYLDLPLKK